MNAPKPPKPIAGIDFYMEGDRLVFTSAYLLKRGYCCNSGCRHCPYRGELPGVPVVHILGADKPSEGEPH